MRIANRVPETQGIGGGSRALEEESHLGGLGGAQRDLRFENLANLHSSFIIRRALVATLFLLEFILVSGGFSTCSSIASHGHRVVLR
jgi:hypothetical protein